MSIYNRPMFRKKGGAAGIMASGPELIKRSNGGGFNLFSSVQANPALSIPKQFDFDQGFKKILQRTPGVYGEGKPQTTIISTEDVDPEAKAKEKTQLEELAGTEAKLAKDTAVKKDKDAIKINETNKKILDKKVTKNDDSIDEGTGEVFTSADDDPSLVTEGETTEGTTTKSFDFSDVNQRIQNQTKELQDVYNNYASDLEDVNSATYLGTTYEQHQQDYFDALNKKPEEVTFSDVKDAAFDMLGYDKDKLDENLSKDQQGSIWLNMMRAGLAMAAGESPNTLTNVAKGFSVGLEGYGRDMKNLRDDYREDVEKYQNTMYRLLKDEKAERVAMNALDVQRKAAQFNIVQQTRGEAREDLLNKLNTEVAMRKIKLNTMSTLAQFDLEKFKLDKSSDEFQKTLEMSKAKIAAMLPDEIQGAIASDLVQLKDPNEPATADNLELTPKGIQSQFDLIKALKEGNKKYPSEAMQKIGISGGTGGYGISAVEDTELTTQMKNELGATIQNLQKSTSPYQKALDPTTSNPSAALSALITEYRPLYNKYKGKIQLNYLDLPEQIKTAIEEEDADTMKVLQRNKSLFTNFGATFG
ncbi:MAG: hypothetical protein CMI74_07215 [Candidatus Pelagibacter sp.]|nr:hypothetical protein [Candidatus Pelagibacter sp.]